MFDSLANGFAYWQNTAIDSAPKTYFSDMSQAMEHVQQAAGDNAKNIRFGNGETGWPTGKDTLYQWTFKAMNWVN